MTMMKMMMDQAAPPAADAESRNLLRLHIRDNRLKNQFVLCVQPLSNQFRVLRHHYPSSGTSTCARSPARMSGQRGGQSCGFSRLSLPTLPNKDTKPLASSAAPLVGDHRIISALWLCLFGYMTSVYIMKLFCKICNLDLCTSCGNCRSQIREL